MTTTNNTDGEWTVVAVCTDGSVTSPIGRYDTERDAELMAKLNNNTPLTPRHVDRYEVRRDE
jgi:hypothetical protein